MAQTVAQAVKIRATSGSTVTANNAITWTAGRQAIGVGSPFQGTGSTIACSDSVNGAYSMRTAQDSGDPAVRIGDKSNISGGLSNLTVSCTGANGLVGIFLEATECDTAGAFDVEAGANGVSASPDAGAITNTTADSLLVAAMANTAGNNPATMNINQTGTEGTWSRDTTNSQELDGTSYPVTCVVWQVVASAAARSHTWGTASLEWVARTACYKAAAGGGGATPPPRLWRMGTMGVH